MTIKDDLQRIIPEGFHKSLARRELYLIVVAGVFVVTTFLLAVGIGVEVGVTKSQRAAAIASAVSAARADGFTCQSRGCLGAAAYMWRDMDTSVKPCDDFYRYACGSYGKRAHIKPDRNKMSIIDEIRERNNQRLRNLLEKPIARAGVDSYERKMKEFYQVCLHDYDRLKEGGQQLVSEMRTQLNGWYALDPNGWSTKWSLLDSVVKLQLRYIAPVLFDYYVVSDLRNPAEDRMIYLTTSRLGMYYKRYLSAGSKIKTAYKKYIGQIARLLLRDAKLVLTPSETNRRVNQFVDDAFSFEMALANITDAAFKNKDDNKRINIRLSELNDVTDQLDWVSLLSAIFYEVRISADHQVALGPYIKTYLSNLNQLMKSYGGRLNRVLNNYFTWTFASYYSVRLSWEYAQHLYEFRGVLYGTSEWTPTWESCFNDIHWMMREGMSAEFIQNHFDTDSIKEVTQMFGVLRDRLADRVSDLEWMDDETKKYAAEKIKAIEGRIGHPEYMDNPSKVDQIYAELTINKSAGFFQNYLNQIHFRCKQYNRELKEGNVNRYWKYGTFLVRTLYHGRYNELLVPAGAMQFPVYSRTMPQYMTYGELGTFMSRAIIAAVDSFGRRFAKDGRSETWWSKASLEKFTNASKCYKDYYAQQNTTFNIDGETMTVAVSSESAMADAIRQTEAVRLAYYAYKRSQDTFGSEKRIPGLELTNEQSFFLAAVQARCAVVREKAAYNNALRGNLPDHVRMNGALSHMEEFQEAFNCPANSKMNADTKCHLF